MGSQDADALLAAVAVGVRLFAGGLFLTWGLAKLRSPRRFESAISDYRLLPRPVVPAAARLIMTLEVATGACLLVGLATDVAAVTAAALAALFAAAIAIDLQRGLEIDCGCSAAKDPISWRHVARNVAIVVAGAAVPTLPQHPWSLDAAIFDAETAGGASSVAVALCLVVALLAAGLAATALVHLRRLTDTPRHH